MAISQSIHPSGCVPLKKSLTLPVTAFFRWNINGKRIYANRSGIACPYNPQIPYIIKEEHMKKKRVVALVLFAVVAMLILSSCSQSDKVSYNIKRQADDFNVRRRITVLNTRTDRVMMRITGLMSISVDSDHDLNIVIEKAPNEFVLDYVHLSQDTTYSVEQIETLEVNKYKYDIIFYPENFISGWYDISLQRDNSDSKTFENTDGDNVASFYRDGE